MTGGRTRLVGLARNSRDDGGQERLATLAIPVRGLQSIAGPRTSDSSRNQAKNNGNTRSAGALHGRGEGVDAQEEGGLQFLP